MVAIKIKKSVVKDPCSEYPDVDLLDVHFIHLGALFTKNNNESFYRVYTKKKLKGAYSIKGEPNCMLMDEMDVFKLSVRKYKGIYFYNHRQCAQTAYTHVIALDDTKIMMSHILYNVPEGRVTVYKNGNSLDLRNTNF